jgi:hypothetical protein
MLLVRALTELQSGRSVTASGGQMNYGWLWAFVMVSSMEKNWKMELVLHWERPLPKKGQHWAHRCLLGVMD